MDGSYGSDLGHAVTAFQKAYSLERTGVADASTQQVLATATPLTAVSQGKEPDRVEVDLARQIVLRFIAGQLAYVSDTSTGNGENFTYHDQNTGQDITRDAITPVGRFEVLKWFPDRHDSGLGPGYDTLTFTMDGVSLHGLPDPSVPSYPASHGCVRLPMAVAKRLFDEFQASLHLVVYVV